MTDIHITRQHHLGLAQARKLAFRWAEVAEEKLDMECTYEEGKTSDLVSFKRSGAHGELKVTKDKFVLDARLGLLLGAFKHKIESAIVKNLDELLAHESPVHAFEKVVAKKPAPGKAVHGKAVPGKAAARKKA